MERKQRERNIVAKMDNSAGVSELDVTDGTRNVEQAPDSKLPFFSKERKAENERQQKLYLDNFCSFAAGFMLFVLAVISFGLITVIATNVEINFRSSATDFRITLSEHYTEVHPNYWQVSSSETVGVYYHMKYQGLDVWRYVHIAELWMWAQGDNTKVHVVTEDDGHRVLMLGDAVTSTQRDVLLSHTVSPGTWMSLQLSGCAYDFSLLHVVSSPGFYRNSSRHERNNLRRLFPEFANRSAVMV